MERACWQHKNNKLEILGRTVFRSWFNPTSNQTKWISDINFFLFTLQVLQWTIVKYIFLITFNVSFWREKINIISTFALLDTRHMWHIRVYHLILSCTIPPVKISVSTENYILIWSSKSKSNDTLLCVSKNNQLPRSKV